MSETKIYLCYFNQKHSVHIIFLSCKSLQHNSYFLCSYQVLAHTVVLHKHMLADLLAELSARSVQGLTYVKYLCQVIKQRGYILLIKIVTRIMNSKTILLSHQWELCYLWFEYHILEGLYWGDILINKALIKY